mgnify:CR=1 FL=1
MKLVIKKSPLTKKNCCEQNGYTSLCSCEKNHFLIGRLFKTLHTKKGICRSFKKDWFCKDCYNVFSLKPLKKYKTLQQFPLCCSKCKSEKITHNNDVVNAIINKKPADELLKYSQKNEIEFNLKYENKYWLCILSNDNQKHMPDFIITLY